MKLQQYFNNQQDIHLSEAEKLDMYQAIMDKQNTRSFLKKRSVLHVKTFTYTSFIVVLLFGFYGMYFFQQDQSLDSKDMMFSTIDTNVAEAGYIAKVVDFAGTFYIEKDGKQIQTSSINDRDVVVLQDKAQLIFHIDTGTQGKITGPAKFTIEKKSENNFKINLMYGDYVEMKSLQVQNIQGVELAVDDIVVSQSSKESPINYQLVKQGEKHVLKNNGAKLIVINQDSQNKTNVNNKQVLAIQGNDVSLFDDVEKFAKAINNKDLSQTFSLALNTPLVDILPVVTKSDVSDLQVDETTPMAAKMSFAPLAETEILSIEDTSDQDQNIPTIAAIAPSDKKIVPNLDQTKVLENKFSPQFIQENLTDLSISYLGGETSFGSDLANLDARIKQVATAFNIAYQSPSGTEKEKLNMLTIQLSELKTAIDTMYFLPPKYIDNIQKTQTWIKYLTAQNFGQYQGVAVEDIAKTIPTSLRF